MRSCKSSVSGSSTRASGSIINRVTGDVQSLRLFIDGVVIQGFVMALSLTVYAAYMVSIHASLALACLATTPVLWVLSARFANAVRPAYAESRDLMDTLVLRFSESIQGINTLKGYALEEHAQKRFAADNDAVVTQRQGIFWKVSTFGPAISFLGQLNIAVLLGYGGWLVACGELPLGSGMVVFAGLLQQFSGQVANLGGLTDSVQQSLTGARRVFEVLDAKPEIASPENPKPLRAVRGELRFEDVCFHYRRTNAVLHGVSFTVKPGEVVAIAGATGSGKSALMALVPRFYDPTAGRILIDRTDLREVAVEELRRQTGVVFQENFLFSNTIAANIAFGNPGASRAAIEKAARTAQAHEFILELPKGYDTILGEGGLTLSGGQRQRLAIARAILHDPAILLLDDPTAAIDPETEHEILEAMQSAIRGRTTLIVAHRLSTLRRADRILVLDRGRVAQFGTHDELVGVEGPYRRAVAVQGVDAESRALLEATRPPWGGTR